MSDGHHLEIIPIPQADQMLAQMIMLTANEEEFMRVANVRPE